MQSASNFATIPVDINRLENIRATSMLPGNLPRYSLQKNGLVAQLVEQRTENPCVGGSIPPQATTYFHHWPDAAAGAGNMFFVTQKL
jgi:hypothetical protein